MDGKHGAMKSKQVDIRLAEIASDDGKSKLWCYVALRNGKDYFLPSFKEVAYMIWMIMIAEQRKYPHGKGARMVADFLYEIAHSPPQDETEMDTMWERISTDSQFKLPGYDRNQPRLF